MQIADINLCKYKNRMANPMELGGKAKKIKCLKSRKNKIKICEQ